MTHKTNYSVVPHLQGWAVKRDGATRASSLHNTQADAISAARPLAQQGRGELRIQGSNGQYRDCRSYGKDPFPPKG